VDFHQELKSLLQSETTSDDVIRKEIVRQVIYKEADLLAVGTKVVPTKNFGDLDIKFSFPETMSSEYPVPEGSIAERRRIKWVDYNMTLEKGQCRWTITDEAVLRQLENYQMEFSRRRASEALAREKDEEILDAVLNGAGNTITIASGNEWDAAGGAPEDDIVNAITKILDTSNILEADIKNMALVVPTSVWAQITKLQTIHNIQQSFREYFEKSYDMKFYPTRYYKDDAVLLVVGDQTAIHGVLQTNRIPLVEEERLKGRGREYVITQFFKTKVTPESATKTTSNRICRIKNVKA